MAREHTGRIARLARRRRDDHDSARYERSQKDACVDDHLSHQDRQADQTRADQRKEYGSRKCTARPVALRSEEHTSELQSLMRISYAVFCLKKKTHTHKHTTLEHTTHTKAHKTRTSPK